MISIPLDEHWLDDEKMVAERVADIVEGRWTLFKPHRKENGNWQLDAGNNWFMELDGGDLRVFYRYGGPKERAVEPWLKHVFGKE